MKKTVNLAVAAALLLSQSAWVPQVLAAKSSLSISAVVTGQCRIRVAENGLGYRIECSGGAPHPQIQTSSGMDRTPASDNGPTRMREPRELREWHDGGAMKPGPITTLVY